jgi:hypothetical protein
MDPLPSLRGHDPTFGEQREAMRDFWELSLATAQMNRLGYSHGDLHPANAGRNVEGTLSFFDFDQSCVGNPWRCRLRDFLGMSTCDWRSMVSLLDRTRHVEFLRVVYWIYRLLRETLILPLRAAQKLRRDPIALESDLRSRASLSGDESMNTLARAWDIAARSNASAPGLYRAYYSLDVAGINFPGERPWALRWERIRHKVDFRGKRFLELGCNLGLLSIHAKVSGAAYCMGVDTDRDVLAAAELTAKAFSVDVSYRQLDLDDGSPWESEITGFDVVAALSVMHWIRDKDRAWSFLAGHREVLYEGHEPEDEAQRLLELAGFTHIIRLGITERSRQIFHASRSN